MSTLDEFRARRAAGQEKLLALEHRDLKRLLRLDAAAYEDGVLPSSTKEMLGLVASMTLRCNDCIDYHIEQCVKQGLSDEQIVEAMHIATIVGGSIVIPHFRHALTTMAALREERATQS